MKSNRAYETLADLILAKEAFTKGVSEGYNNFNRGLKQSENEINEYIGLEPKGTADLYTRQQDLEREQFANQALNQYSPMASNVGQVLGESAPWVGMLPLRGLKGAFAAGGIQSFPSYVPEGESRAERTVSGAAFSGLTHGIIQGGSKGINALRGNFTSPEEASKIALSEKYDVPLPYQDINKSVGTRATGLISEKAPMLSKSYRETQMSKAGKAANKMAQKAYSEVLETPYNGIPELKKAAQGTGDYADSARTALQALEDAGDDWHKITKASGNAKAVQAKLLSEKHYNKVNKIAANLGAVNTERTIRALEEGIKEASIGVGADPKLIGLLEKRRNDFIYKDLDFNAARKSRTRLSDEITDATKGGNEIVKEEGTRIITKVKKALDEDMKTFAISNGSQLKTAWEKADKFYKEKVVPYKNKALAKSLGANANADEIYSTFINVGRDEGGEGAEAARKFFNALDEKGQSAVRYGMVKNAYESALDSERGAFDPAKFATKLDDVASSKGVFFEGKAKEEIDGFKKLMRYAENSKPALDKINAEDSLVSILSKGTALGTGYAAAGGPGVLAVAAVPYALSVLFNSKAGRNFLASSSKLDPTSEGFKALIRSSATQTLINDMNKKMQAASKENPDFSKMSDEEFNAAYNARKRTAPDFSKMSDEEFNAAYEKKKGAPYKVADYLKERNQQQ